MAKQMPGVRSNTLYTHQVSLNSSVFVNGHSSSSVTWEPKQDPSPPGFYTTLFTQVETTFQACPLSGMWVAA